MTSTTSDPVWAPAVHRILLSLIALAVVTITDPGRSDAQVRVEANGNLGFTIVNSVNWLGQGAFDAERLAYGGDVAVVFGRRYGRGLQLALDFGYQHLLSYKFIQQGVPQAYSADVYRAAMTTRFWFSEGLWFGEAGFGAFRFAARTDPSITAGFGTAFEIGERLSIPVRARGAVVFGGTSQIGPVWLSTGLSYRLSS